MSSTFEPDLFVALVYEAVKRIPYGKVTSYGAIARLIEHPRYSRHVGQALKRLPGHLESEVPWHRVINSSSTISPRGDNGEGAHRQAQKLLAEGVQVVQDEMGTYKVDKACQWDVQGTLEDLLNAQEPMSMS